VRERRLSSTCSPPFGHRPQSKRRRTVRNRFGVGLAANIAAVIGLTFGCSIPTSHSALSLSQSVSASVSSCGSTIAGGIVSNSATTTVLVRLDVTWLSITSSVLASAHVPTITVPAGGSTPWSARLKRHAPNALSCNAAIATLKAA